MKFDENSPGAFVNEAVMDEDECLGAVHELETLESTQAKQETLLAAAGEQDGDVSGSQADRWKKLSTQIRGAIAVKNAIVKPNKRKLGRKSTTNIDPFLQRFSTREIGLTTQVSRGSLRTVDEEESESTDGDVVPGNEDTCRQTSTYLRLTFSRLLSPAGVIDPDGSILHYWLYFLITAIRYNFWVIILRFAFSEAQENYSSLWWVLDSLADLIYILDILINCRVGFFEEGILVRDSERAFKQYLRSPRFFVDLLSVVPLELLYFQTGVQPILRFPRFLKIYRSQDIKSRLEGRANHPTIVRVFFLIHLMFLMLHWNAAIYFLISRAEGFGTNKWLYPALNGSYDTLTRKYVHSFYWSALTLTTIGDLPPPETNIEYFYTIACYLSGVFIFAMIVGNAGSIILDRNASRMQFEKQRDNAKNYMKIHNVPGGLQRRVLKWYDYSWSRGRMGGGGGDLKSLHLLPDKMKTEIALHVHLETLKKVTFLQNCEREFLHELLLKMKLHIFTPGDLIIRHGEIAREMYLIAHGRIEVISETGKVLKELGSGDFFGEIGILSLSEGQNRRTADVRSIGYTECFVLSKDDVLGEIQQFPEAQRILAEYGKKRLQNTSGDPRLVKLDGQDAPQNKTSSPPERSHVVDVDQSVKYIDKSEKNRLKLSNDGREKDLSQDQRGRTLSALMKSTKDLMIPALVNRNSNVSRSWETGLEDRCRRDFNIGACDPDMCCSSDSNSSCSHDSNTCKARDLNSCATHDLYFCLNTLDTLKAALQNTIENEVKKHKRYISRLECDLEIEKERNHLAEQEATMQKDEISALTNANTILQQSIIERDKRISELEYAIQRKFKKHVNETRQGCDTRASEIETEKNERVLLDDDLDSLNVGPRPSPTDGNLTIRDTAC